MMRTRSGTPQTQEERTKKAKKKIPIRQQTKPKAVSTESATTTVVTTTTGAHPLLLPEIIKAVVVRLPDGKSVIKCRQVCTIWLDTVDRIKPSELPKIPCETVRIFWRGRTQAEMHLSFHARHRLLPKTIVITKPALSALPWRDVLARLVPEYLILGPLPFQKTAILIQLFQDYPGIFEGVQKLSLVKFEFDHVDDNQTGAIRQFLAGRNSTLRFLKIDSPHASSFHNTLEYLFAKDNTINSLNSLHLLSDSNRQTSVFTKEIAELTLRLGENSPAGHLKDITLFRMRIASPQTPVTLLNHWLTIPIAQRRSQTVDCNEAHSRVAHWFLQTAVQQRAIQAGLWSCLDSKGAAVGSGVRGIQWTLECPIWDWIPQVTWD